MKKRSLTISINAPISDGFWDKLQNLIVGVCQLDIVEECIVLTDHQSDLDKLKDAEDLFRRWRYGKPLPILIDDVYKQFGEIFEGKVSEVEMLEDK